ncbi:unnamed protein product [Prunus armeniaca]
MEFKPISEFLGIVLSFFFSNFFQTKKRSRWIGGKIMIGYTRTQHVACNRWQKAALMPAHAKFKFFIIGTCKPSTNGKKIQIPCVDVIAPQARAWACFAFGPTQFSGPRTLIELLKAGGIAKWGSCPLLPGPHPSGRIALSNLINSLVIWRVQVILAALKKQ